MNVQVDSFPMNFGFALSSMAILLAIGAGLINLDN